MTPWPGFGTAPLPDAARRAPRAGLDPRTPGLVFGTLALRWRADQPIHIPGGPWAPGDGPLVRPAAREGDALAIPGATLRRIARARFEAITRACAGAGLHPRPADAGDPFAPCVGGPGLPLCPACAVFGAPGQRGRVRVDSALTDAHAAWVPLPVAATPAAASLPERRFFGGPGREISPAPGEAEVIPTGAELSGAVILDGLHPTEAGGLLAALGLAPGTFSKVGHAKTLGFGRLRPVHVDWQLTDGAQRPVKPDPARWRAAFVASPDYWRAGEEATVRLFTRGDW